MDEQDKETERRLTEEDPAPETENPVPEAAEAPEEGGEGTGEEKKRPFAADLFDWAEALVYALAMLVVVSAFFIRLSGVVGSSMYPTLEDGDQLLISAFGYKQPERGDIVVLMADGYMEKPLVKRVIGLGGDTVEVDSLTNAVYVNGQAVYEPYINQLNEPMYTGDMDGPFTVPEGQVFVMGDNRNGSSDSRKLMDIGPIPYEKIVGKAIFRVFPFGRMGTLK